MCQGTRAEQLACIAECTCSSPGPIGADTFQAATRCFNQACTEPSCTAELADCTGECLLLFMCVEDCPACDDACAQACKSSHPDGLTSYNAWIACVLVG